MTRAEIQAIREVNSFCRPELTYEIFTALLAQAEAAIDLAEALRDLREWACEGISECNKTIDRPTSYAEDIRDAYAERSALASVSEIVNRALAKRAALMEGK